MSFLNPLYLFSALVALVPLIIHLLHRERARIEVFPSLEFLRKMMRRKTRRFHLKQILLLVARILLLLFIALALARPTITGGKVVKGHLPTTAAIILDDSYSMLRRRGGGTVFDLARNKTTELLGNFGKSDEIHLLAGSSHWREVSESGVTDIQRLADRVSNLRCSNLTTEIVSPLERAVSILTESSDPNREIYIISDMQKHGWEGLSKNLGAEDSAIKVMIVDVGEEEPNTCVREVGFKIPAGSDDLEMNVTFERFNATSKQGRVAEVFIKDGLLGRSVFSPGDVAREKETFSIPAFEGYLWGEVRIAEDALAIDDTRYFALPSRRRTIGTVGGSHYLRTALNPAGGGSFRPVEVEEGGITHQSLSMLDVLILANVARLSPLETEALSDYLAGGGSLLVFLGNQVDVGAYNRHLLPRIGDLKIEGIHHGDEWSFYTIDRLERGHRIFSKFRSDQNPFSDSRFFGLMRVTPGTGRVVASFSDGSPAIVEASDRVMIVATAAEVSSNDFVLTPQFLPLVHEMLLYLSSGMKLSQSYNPGDEIFIRLPNVRGEVVLEGPTGAIRHFPQGAGESAGYRFTSPYEPGVYFLKSEEETLSVFAVNVDTDESDLTKVALSRVESGLKGFEIARISVTDDINESVSFLRRGRDLSRWFLWGALILIIFETFLASNIPLRFRPGREEDALAHR
jgi:hypothetical protein